MKILEMQPDGWPMKLKDFKSGFFVFEEILCFKSDYGRDGVFNQCGELFWGAESAEATQELMIQPVHPHWVEVAE